MSVHNTRLGGLEEALNETGRPISFADWSLDGGFALRLYGIGKAVTVGHFTLVSSAKKASRTPFVA
ncbi:uncharacterized protein NFIA_077010 [Aspergillus fischeri NRRL 181]|uniref:Uncharacterized protein n=1 Tax=Neosartorya fischeri (strain ATCC 1020 / DSM 3700 / CBS 544.65 / FGSC A1164 / JCM 1740 / NRRL 181 / WB 181) TaxID=331117 RepID=A1DEG1_NEOFI|nr:uncharacterized protein NFIA_077010 [Aspergillus fischeri NRRL 181]EAW17768.1 hypothetical protein NFIA_077010 [Aspergillus fischeri NRRL 181]